MKPGNFSGFLAQQQSLDADILVEVWPMDAISCPAKAKFVPTRKASHTLPARIPADRHRNAAAVLQIYGNV